MCQVAICDVCVKQRDFSRVLKTANFKVCENCELFRACVKSIFLECLFVS